jgi:predicted nucleotide-binding protein
MSSREEIAQKLQDFIDMAGRLRSLDYGGAEWALWEDEVYQYLQRVADQQAATDFQNKLHNVEPIASIFHGPIVIPESYVRALDKAVVHLHVVKARVERGDYDAALSGKEAAPSDQSSPRPSVFISHSGEPPIFSRLARFLEDLGVEPVVAEWLPFKGQTVPVHVRSAMDGCQAAIVFATASDQVGDRSQPGRGVLTETGILQERFGDRVIYLVEEGADFGPMVGGFARESFTQDCLERAFHRIVIELKAHGIV